MPSDRGLARERTQLAWSRSSLAIGAIAGATVKTGIDGGEPALAIVAGLTLIGLAALVWYVGTHATRRVTALRTTTLASLLSAGLALALVLIT